MITPANVTVTADKKEKIYGDEDPKITVTVQGLKRGESGGVIKCNLERERGEDVGEYNITVTGAEDQGNYKVSFVNSFLKINPANLTVRGWRTQRKHL